MSQRETSVPRTVGDVMQEDVVTIDVAAGLDVADRLMRADRIRHLPVVDRGRLVGLLTQRDLFRAGAGASLATPGAGRAPGVTVRDLMATEVFTTMPGSTLESAVEMMLLKDVGCLPVLAADELVGLLTQTDCLRYLADLLRTP